MIQHATILNVIMDDNGERFAKILGDVQDLTEMIDSPGKNKMELPVLMARHASINCFEVYAKEWKSRRLGEFKREWQGFNVSNDFLVSAIFCNSNRRGGKENVLRWMEALQKIDLKVEKVDQYNLWENRLFLKLAELNLASGVGIDLKDVFMNFVLSKLITPQYALEIMKRESFLKGVTPVWELSSADKMKVENMIMIDSIKSNNQGIVKSL